MTFWNTLPWAIIAIGAALIGGYMLGRRGSANPATNDVQDAVEPGSRPGASTAAIFPTSASMTRRQPSSTSSNAVPPPASAGQRGAPARTTLQHDQATPAAHRMPPSSGAPALPRAPAAARAGGNLTAILAGARSWGYQLQKPSLAELDACPFDVLVIDYALDGSDETALKPSDLQRLQTKPDGSRRIVLAYFSIGEAESYRFYWQEPWGSDNTRPGWIIGENPEWDENFAVRFWEPGWQNLMLGSPSSYLDRLVAQGFDGVYLDKCDVYEDIKENYKAVARQRPTIEMDMVAFIGRLSSHAKSLRPGFLVIMQNAEQLLEHREVRSALDGVAKEELVFGLDGPEKKNNGEDLSEAIRCLDLLRRDGKAVLVVEYLDNRRKMEDASQICAERGYVLTVSPQDRELDRLGIAV